MAVCRCRRCLRRRPSLLPAATHPPLPPRGWATRSPPSAGRAVAATCTAEAAPLVGMARAAVSSTTAASTPPEPTTVAAAAAAASAAAPAVAGASLPPLPPPCAPGPAAQHHPIHGTSPPTAPLLAFIPPPPYAPPNRWTFPSTVGGKPLWLLPDVPPPPPTCACAPATPLSFLAQVYAPWPGRDDAFHRSLALFVCVASGCAGGGPSGGSGSGRRTVVAYRAQLPRVSPYYPSAYDPTGGGVPPALRGGGPTMCAGCGFRSSAAGGVRGCTGCTGVQVLPAMPLRIGAAGGEGGGEGSDGSWSGSDDGSGSYDSDSGSDSEGPGGGTRLPAVVKGAAVAVLNGATAITATTAATGQGDGTTDDHGDCDSDKGDSAGNSGSGSKGGGGGDSGAAVGGTLPDVSVSELEAYTTAPPPTADEQAFRAFAAAVADAPTQVLRYGAVPLWTAAAGVPPSDAAGGGNGVPPCGTCGARRAFELQVLPSLLYYLDLDRGGGGGGGGRRRSTTRTLAAATPPLRAGRRRGGRKSRQWGRPPAPQVRARRRPTQRRPGG